MEVDCDSDDNTPLYWINHKTDVLEEYKANEIKEELDEDVINIDPELELKPNLIQFNSEIIAMDLLKVPIIYTTKLEEMNVFKRKFDDINIQCFTERVYEESKPKYICAPIENEQSSSYRGDVFFPTPLYCEMEKKISAINKKCVSQNFGKLTRRDSVKKVENCPTGIDKEILNKFCRLKGVSVVLNDFRKTKKLPVKPKNADALLVKDKQLNTMDIFVTTKESKITQHYNFVCGEPLPTKLTMVSLSEHVVCCWYTREEFFLSQNSSFNQHNNVVRLGRRPHGCVQNKCKCCCKHKQSGEGDSANEFNLPNKVDIAMQNLKENIQNSISKISNTAGTSLLNSQNRDSSTKIFSKKKPSRYPHKLILKTSSYQKPFIQKQICSITNEKKDNLKGKLIHLTNAKTKESEFYELDNDGNVCAHAQFKKCTVAHKYLLDLNKPKIVANICCWMKRENIISKLNSKQLSESAIKCIRRPHSCFPGKCICCCYTSSIRNKITLLDISLIKGEHSINYTMSDKLPKITSVTSGKNFNDNISTVNESITEKATSVQKINQTQVSEQYNTTNTSFESNLHFSNTNNLISTSNNTNQNLNQCLNVNAIIERNGSKLVETVKIAKGTGASTTKERIVTAILETFRNARLTINNEGKVAAALNTPAHTLSMIELKVLAHILSSAQNEVNNVLKHNSSEGNIAMIMRNYTQIDDRSLNTTEQNPVREAITDKNKIMTPPLTIDESLPTVVGVDKSTLSIDNRSLNTTEQNPVREAVTDKNKIMTPPLTIDESLPTVVGVDKSTLSIDNRSLNTTEQNLVREAITDKIKIMTPPLTFIGKSLPTVVGVDKSMLSDFNYKLESKQNQLRHSFRSFNNNLFSECDANETMKVPQIQNVYSLNDKQNSNKDQTDASSSATMWYIEPKKNESPQCSILKKRMDLTFKSDLSSSRSLLRYKSSRELKRKSSDDLQTLSETEAPVKILNSSISDTDTNSKTQMSRYQIISSNDSKELKSPNDITLVMSNTKNVPLQIDSSPAIPAHTLPTQSNPTVINMTLEDNELNTTNPKAVSVLPFKFTEHPEIRLKETQQRNEVQLVGATAPSTLNSQRHVSLQKINVQKWTLPKPGRTLPKTGSQKPKARNINLKHSMLPRPIAPKPMIVPHDTGLRIIVPADTPVKSDMFSPEKKPNQRNSAAFKKSSAKIETKSVDAINVNVSGDTEAADQDVEFVIKIGDDNVNVKMTESDLTATTAGVKYADPTVIIDDVDKNSVIADNKVNGDDECILGV